MNFELQKKALANGLRQTDILILRMSIDMNGVRKIMVDWKDLDQQKTQRPYYALQVREYLTTLIIGYIDQNTFDFSIILNNDWALYRSEMQ